MSDIDPEIVIPSMAVAVLTLLNAMSDEQRLEIFCNYCVHCGSKDSSICTCMRRRKLDMWNDLVGFVERIREQYRDMGVSFEGDAIDLLERAKELQS